MKTSLYAIIAGVAFSAGGMAPAFAAETEPLVRIQFDGVDRILQNEEAETFQRIAAIPDSERFQRQVIQRLASSLPALLEWEVQHGGGGFSRNLVGLIDDAIHSGFRVEMRGESYPPSDWLVAVRADDEQYKEWRSRLLELARLLKYGEPASTSIDGARVLSFQHSGGRPAFRFGHRNGWLVAGASFSEEGLAHRAWQQAASDAGLLFSDSNDWLSIEGRPDDLGWTFPVLSSLQIDFLSLSYSWQNKKIRTEGRIKTGREMPGDLVDWRIPTEIVRDPLLSFTAMRGLQPLLSELDWVKQLELPEIPSQAFYWARSDIAFKTEGAFPVEDSQATFNQLKSKVPELVNPNLMERAIGRFIVETNRSGLMWKGLPIFVPFIWPIEEANGDFIYSGIFPMTNVTDNPPPPQALLEQFRGRDEVVYYDWEITQARLEQYDQVEPFVDLFLRRDPPAEGTFGNAWLKQIAPMLGNTITEIVRVDGHELKLTRRSHLGLTAWELNWLVEWMDRKDFPQPPYQWPGPYEPANPATDNNPPPVRRPANDASGG